MPSSLSVEGRSSTAGPPVRICSFSIVAGVAARHVVDKVAVVVAELVVVVSLNVGR